MATIKTEAISVPELRLTIKHGNNIFSPPIRDEITVEWDRSGSPGKMEFTTVKVSQNGMSFQEGDQVCLYLDNEIFFVGYVFKKSRDKEHHISVTCYDQLRYFKNKYSYVFVNQTAKDVILALAKDYNLDVGVLEDTGYIIPTITEENKEAWDIVLSALDETLVNTGNMYVLYDDAGKLCLKNSVNMKCDTVITDTTAENFDYSTSIDDGTYNRVVLYYKPSSTTDSISGKALDGDGIITGGSIPLIAMQWAIGIANDNTHGYSQANRWGPDYDCSSLVISAYKKAGVAMTNVYASGSMTTATMTANGFTDVTATCNLSTGSGLQEGDILWKSGHVAMYIGAGRIVEASSARGNPQTGDQTGTEIKTDNFRRGFTRVWRYGGV